MAATERPGGGGWIGAAPARHRRPRQPAEHRRPRSRLTRFALLVLLLGLAAGLLGLAVTAAVYGYRH